MAKKKENEKLNPFVKFMFMIVLPIIVASILAVVVLSFAGIDVIGWSKEKMQNVPVISNFIKTDEEKDLSRKLEVATETIESQKDEINALKQQVEDLQAQLEENELEMTKLENEQQSEESIQSEGDRIELEPEDEIKQLASSFRKMDKEQAAKIVENLDSTTAILLLSNVSGNVRGEIFEQMDPKIAANLMESMAN